MRPLLLLGLLLPTAASAVPVELAHQGRLLDITGTPLDGRHALDVALYDAEGAVVPVYAEAADADFIEGYYSIRLGADGRLDHDVLAAGDLWLGLSVDGGLELPRIPLASAPYARQADRARALQGGPVDATEIRVNGVLVIDASGELAIPADGDTLAELGCGPGEVALSSGFGWVCAPMAEGDTLADLSCDPGEVAVWNGLVWNCGLPPGDGDTLGELFCDSAETPVWTGFAWECRPYGDSDTLATLGCDPGEIAVYTGFAWECQVQVDRDTLATLGCDPGEVALFDGVGWTCSPIGDADSLGALGCDPGEVPMFDGADWVCLPLGDADTLAGLPCSDNQIARYDAPTRTWECSDDLTVDEGTVEDWITDDAIDLAAGTTIDGEAPLTADDLSWGAILGVPADVRDGDSDVLADLECDPGEIAAFDGAWACAEDMQLTDVQVRGFVEAAPVDLAVGSTVGGRELVSLDELVWSNVGGKPAGFSDGIDDDSFAGISCDPGQVLVWDDVVGFDCATPAISGDSLADLSLLCEDAEVPIWDEGAMEWTCGPDMVLSAPEVIAIVEGEDLALGAGTTIGGSPVLTEEEALEALLDADGLAEGVLPFNGLDEISNDLLSNQFVEDFEVRGTPIPDNSPPGVEIVIDVPDIGIAEWLTVAYVIDNSDVTGLHIDITAPDGTNYLLYDGERAGAALAQTFPSVDPTLSGDLTEWVGRNPAGAWTLHVVDDDFLNNEIDGEVTSYTIEFQHVSNQQVALNGDLLIGDMLEVDADAHIRGMLTVDGNIDANSDVDIAGDLWVHGELTVDTPVDLPAGSMFDGVPLEQVNKSVYTRWGRTTCEEGAEAIYTGFAAGQHYNHSGGSGELVCMHADEEWGEYNSGNQNGGLFYKTEYQTSGYGLSSYVWLHDYEVPCTVCMTNGTINLMIPARRTCPEGWRSEYTGQLFSDHYTHHRSGGAVCVSDDAEAIGVNSDENGALLYPVEWEGGDPLGGMNADWEVACVVCSR